MVKSIADCELRDSELDDQASGSRLEAAGEGESRTTAIADCELRDSGIESLNHRVIDSLEGRRRGRGNCPSTPLRFSQDRRIEGFVKHCRGQIVECRSQRRANRQSAMAGLQYSLSPVLRGEDGRRGSPAVRMTL
jgi:hypothetical protein